LEKHPGQPGVGVIVQIHTKVVQYVAPAVDGLRHDPVQAVKVILRQMQQIINAHTIIALKQVAVEYGEIAGQALQASHAGLECSSQVEIMPGFQ
jgi:hypothetical protein